MKPGLQPFIVEHRERRRDEGLAGVVESDLAKFWMAGRFRPCNLTVDAEHRGHSVVPKRND